MKDNKLLAVGAILLLIVSVVAVMHLSTREDVAEGIVELTAGGKKISVTLDDIAVDAVKGIRVNGKGEEIQVEGEGILLGKLLESKGVKDYAKVSVVADDSYSAQVTYEEISAGAEAYIMADEGEARLVVFGDSDSKRSVSNVKQIVVE